MIHARSTEIEEVPKLAKNKTLDLALGHFNYLDWEEELLGTPDKPAPEPTPIFHALWRAKQAEDATSAPEVFEALNRELGALLMYEQDFYLARVDLGHQVSRAIEAMSAVLMWVRNGS